MSHYDNHRVKPPVGTQTAQTANKYQRKINQRAIDNDYNMDSYDIDAMWPDPNTAVIHARKKLMAIGMRSGGKTRKQDIEEAIWSLQEALKLEQ